MNAVEILDRLVSFPSVVGTENSAISFWIRDFLLDRGCEVSLLPGPEGDRYNLFASLGPKERPGYMLSGHMDVVPAKEPAWRSDPFKLTKLGSQLVGRGSCDMKGFLAAGLATVDELKNRQLEVPLQLAFSYDEEAGCRGVPSLIKALPDLCPMPLAVVIGEPSGMRPVLAHKGKAAARLTVRGRAGHSSRPDLALNAVHLLSQCLAAALDLSEELEKGAQDALFVPPYSTLQVGVIRGGEAVNIIPDVASLDLEVRAIPGQLPLSLLEPLEAIISRLKQKGIDAAFEVLSAYPALALCEEAPIRAVLETLTGMPALQTVSYGTEAGLYQQAGFEAIICGPGDIARAHKPNEWIELDELAACQSMIRGLITDGRR